jgi:hypothetical protein
VSVIAEHACHGASGAAPIAKAVIKAYLEKYWPDKFSDKAIAERIKGLNAEKPAPAKAEEEEDMVPDLPGAPAAAKEPEQDSAEPDQPE